MSVEEVRKRVKPEYDAVDPDFWDYHVAIVYKYAVLLAEKLDADKEVVELGAYLHDYGQAKHPDCLQEHHTTGVKLAGELLVECGYDQELITHVQECIRTHRGSLDLKPQSLEAHILTNADAMSHFDGLFCLFKVEFRKGKDAGEAATYLRDKIERDWTKKLTLPEAKAMVKEKYEAAKLLLDASSRQ